MEAKMKNILWIAGGVAGFICIVLLVSLINSSTTSKDRTKVIKNKEADITYLQTEITALKEELDRKEAIITDNNSKIAALNKKVELAKPWFELTENEKQRKIEEDKALEEAKRIEAEKKAMEEEEEEATAQEEILRKLEEEIKKGYDTGITYDQLARKPDDYEWGDIKFRGKVVQVIEEDGETQIRIAVDNSYDKILYGTYDSSIVDSRILVDDVITVMGISTGLITYQSTIGGNITIPSMLIFYIEDK